MVIYDKRIYFLESLDDGEPREKDDLIPLLRNHFGFRVTTMHEFHTAAEFSHILNGFSSIERRASGPGVSIIGPFIHISAHGLFNEERTECIGIAACPSSPDEKIAWEVLEEALRGFNAAAPNWVVVCLSACRGLTYRKYQLDLSTITESGDNTYYGIVGSRESLRFEANLAAFKLFYSGIWFDYPIDTLIKLMNIDHDSFENSPFEAHLDPAWMKFYLRIIRETLVGTE